MVHLSTLSVSKYLLNSAKRILRVVHLLDMNTAEMWGTCRTEQIAIRHRK